MIIKPEALTIEAFQEYGQVIQVPEKKEKGAAANQGSATRFNYLAELANLRTGSSWGVAAELQNPPAKLNICLFRSQPREIPFKVKLLERHLYSSQMFVPMSNQKAGYLVVVAKNNPVDQKPDMSTLRVFVANSTQAFNYKEGIWHHPMIALYSVIDFVCLVYERNKNQVLSTEDCEEVYFPSSPITIDLKDRSKL